MTLALHIVAFILWYSFVIVVGAGLICLALSPFVLALQLVSTALAILYFVAVGAICVVTLPITWFLRLRNRHVRTFYRWYRERHYYQDRHQSSQWQKSSRQATQHSSSRESRDRDVNGDAFDPYQILGVPRDVSPEALAVAYRKKMQMNHPDKVATLDPALQDFATARTKLIGRAFRELIETR